MDNINAAVVEQNSDGSITVRIPDVGGYVAREDDNNIASTILWYFAKQSLAQPAPNIWYAEIEKRCLSAGIGWDSENPEFTLDELFAARESQTDDRADGPFDDLVHHLRMAAQAYHKEIFTELTEEERSKPGMSVLITRISGGMGRHFSPLFTEAAKAIESLQSSGTKGLEGLAIRQWTCQCGASHDRDVNAAKNIARRGLATLAEGANHG